MSVWSLPEAISLTAGSDAIVELEAVLEGTERASETEERWSC